MPAIAGLEADRGWAALLLLEKAVVMPANAGLETDRGWAALLLLRKSEASVEGPGPCRA